MKIIKKITTFGIICIVGICTQSFATSKGIINSETVRLRKEASSDSTILELMSLNEEVEILSEEDGWYKIKYKNITGYTNKEYIKETENVTENVSDSNNEKNKIEEGFNGKLSEKVKLKILPLINSSDIITLPKDTEIKVTEIINDWCRIESNLNTGWIRINTLTKNIQNEQQQSSNENSNKQDTKQQVVEQEETEKKEEDKTKIGYVNVDTLNVRSKADSESKILTDISKNTQVEILGEEEGWYKIKVKNTTGYVAIKFISDKKVAETTSRGTDKERMPIENQNNAETNKEETAYANNDKTESSSSNTVIGNQIVEYAKQYLGCKYVSGGTSPKTGFDCSGFTYYVYKNFGKTLSRSSKGQINNGKAVQKTELQLGDILVFNDDSNKSIGHVGIYIGGNKFIHAANAKKGVIITSLSDSYYSARYVGARRII